VGRRDTPVVAAVDKAAGVFVNLAPGPEDTYKLILAPIQMLDVVIAEGWKTRPCGLREHAAQGIPQRIQLSGRNSSFSLVYGEVVDDLIRFGEMMGWNLAVLE